MANSERNQNLLAGKLKDEQNYRRSDGDLKRRKQMLIKSYREEKKIRKRLGRRGIFKINKKL